LRLADFLASHSEAILQEWEDFARTLEPAAGVMTTKALRNHAAEMLNCIAEDIGTAQTRAEGIRSRMARNRKPRKPTPANSTGWHAWNRIFR